MDNTLVNIYGKLGIWKCNPDGGLVVLWGQQHVRVFRDDKGAFIGGFSLYIGNLSAFAEKSVRNRYVYNMASSSTKLTMKILIDSKNNRVLFAEASKEVIDFFFSLLRLPVSTVITLLNKKGMVGSLGNLYQSVETMSDTYLQPDLHKDVLLKSRAPEISALLTSNDDEGAIDNIKPAFYTCATRTCGYHYVTCDNKSRCDCGKTMSTEMHYIGSSFAGNVSQ
ncbi:hypothetical protein Fmac_022958 [Flemingia macrophylla]|uniref:Uncharacterized protein n=1 Tax=Flemingia macrophylla TaxID=520843 RepID=A0ABD1LLS1_9FABA